MPKKNPGEIPMWILRHIAFSSVPVPADARNSAKAQMIERGCDVEAERVKWVLDR